MLHVGELPKILAFLTDQREKLVTSDPLFAGVLKPRDDAAAVDLTNNGSGVASGTIVPSFEEEKKQLAARRERERRLRERRAKLESDGVARTEEEIEALLLLLETEGEAPVTNPRTNPQTYPSPKTADARRGTAAGAAGGGAVTTTTTTTTTLPTPAPGAKTGGTSSSFVFVKEKSLSRLDPGKVPCSLLTGLKSNNIGIKVFSNEGAS